MTDITKFSLAVAASTVAVIGIAAALGGCAQRKTVPALTPLEYAASQNNNSSSGDVPGEASVDSYERCPAAPVLTSRSSRFFAI